MTRNHQKNASSTKKLVFLITCAALLGAALIADVLWTSSSSLSSSYFSISSNWAIRRPEVLVVPDSSTDNVTTRVDEKQVDSRRFLPGTYFDLPAPDLEWEEMPSAPVPRLDGAAIQIKNIFYVFAGYGTIDYLYIIIRLYAPATQLWRGRLHVMGGSKENRHTPGLEHWSIAVKDGKVLEDKWRTEIPIPRGGPHRACVVANDRLFVIGGQEGDFMAKPGSPIFKCSRRFEVVYGDVYMLDDEMKWKTLTPMPKPDSHIECAWVIVNNSLIIAGGTTEKHPITKRMILVGEVFRFDLDTLTWSVIGKLPYRIKTTLAGFWDGYLYFTSGQRDRGPDNPQPRKVVADMWRTKLKI
ncbi:Kelch repeat-containing protein, partial [Cucurbita argyrosperma subsp. argyrosperma]